MPRKRPHEEYEDDDDNDDETFRYRTFLHLQMRSSTAEKEFDRCFLTPSPDRKAKTLDYWRDYSHDFPHLNLMARDTFAVPATGAGIEGMFSKSGQAATWTRARLQATTIVEIMLYKEFLGRLGHPLNEADERQKAERKKDKKKMKATRDREPQPENQMQIAKPTMKGKKSMMIDWALEW
jgi:hypothetical protein